MKYLSIIISIRQIQSCSVRSFYKSDSLETYTLNHSTPHSNMSRQEIYSPEGLRQDGRRWNEIRNFNCLLNTHQHNSNGSAFLQHGNNKVLTLINGPSEAPQTNFKEGKIAINLNVTNFSKFERRNSKIRKTDKKLMEMKIILENIFNKNVLLHLYPNTVITVTSHVLQQDGSLLPCLINSITLALCMANIAMYDFITGISIGLFNSSIPILDLNHNEQLVMSCVNLGILGDTEKLSLLYVDDKIPLDNLEKILALGIAGGHQIKKLMEEELKKYSTSRLQKIK